MFFTYSIQHNWQGDPAVQQILVFPHTAIENDFTRLFNERVEKDGIMDASDSGIGAVYKLRSELGGNGKFIPVIRCGVTGVWLWEGVPCWSPTDALLKCYGHISDMQKIPKVFLK